MACTTKQPTAVIQTTWIPLLGVDTTPRYADHSSFPQYFCSKAAARLSAMLRHSVAMQTDVDRLKDQIQGASGDVDLLLTCEWPENLLLSLPPDSAPEGVNPSGSACMLTTTSSSLTPMLNQSSQSTLAHPLQSASTKPRHMHDLYISLVLHDARHC